jgi:hypothetical protein
MLERGWIVDTAPGKPIRLVQDDAAFVAFSELQEYLDGRTTPAQWRERVIELGIGDLVLG